MLAEGLMAVVEMAQFKEAQCLAQGLPAPHEPGMRGMQHQKISHARDLRAGHGNLPVIGARQQRREKGVERTITGNHTAIKSNWSEPIGRVATCSSKLPCARSQELPANGIGP